MNRRCDWERTGEPMEARGPDGGVRLAKEGLRIGRRRKPWRRSDRGDSGRNRFDRGFRRFGRDFQNLTHFDLISPQIVGGTKLFDADPMQLRDLHQIIAGANLVGLGATPGSAGREDAIGRSRTGPRRRDFYFVANLQAIVRMKLIANRRKDQVHLLDMIGVGLIDESWPARFPEPLGERLKELRYDPNG